MIFSTFGSTVSVFATYEKNTDSVVYGNVTNSTVSDENVTDGNVSDGNIALSACGDNLTCYLTSDGTLIIDGEGEMYDFGYQDSIGTQPWKSFQSSIKNIIISEGVTSIGDRAFYCCYNLEDITIPDSITNIGERSFGFCESLKNIIIPNSVISIGEWAFSNCDNLLGIVIPNSVMSIGYSAFSCCGNLTNVTIPDNVTSISSRVFDRCRSLKSISIPDSVNSIGYEAFDGCSNLSNIHFCGTEEQWNRIMIEEANESLTSIVHIATDENDDGICDDCANLFDAEDIFAEDEKSIDGHFERYFRFIPEKSGYYRFYSESNEGADMWCCLKDVDGNYLETANSDKYGNFELTYHFKSGKTYYFRIYNTGVWIENIYGNIKLIPLVTVPLGISFEPAKPLIFTEDISVTYNYDNDWNGFYSYPVVFCEGDKLTINFSDDTTKEFTFVPGEYVWQTGCFVAENGEKLNNVTITTEQKSESLWQTGTYSATVTYKEYSCSVPIIIKENPIETLSAKYNYTLYDDYDCKLGDSESKDWSNYIREKYITCTAKMKDGTEVVGSINEIQEKFDNTVDYAIQFEKIGVNEGEISLGAFEGIFYVNIEEYPNDLSSQPECRVKAYQLDLSAGDTVDYQLIEFADKGHNHTINIFNIPKWLTLSNDGKLTGTVPEPEYNYNIADISFDVRWDDSYAHCDRNIQIIINIADTKVVIPENVEIIPYNTVVDVEASENEPKWFKIRSPNTNVEIGSSPAIIEDYVRSIDMEVFDAKGTPVYCDGYGDYIFTYGHYMLAYGEYYYICVKESGKLYLDFTKWMPEWTDDGNEPESTNSKLISTNVEKTFLDDDNTIWNIYSIETDYDIDFNGGFTYEYFGSMTRIASPVNIHMETANVTSNVEIIHNINYKYDPNNIEECEAIGASTTQSTMKDELCEGEKEYRFDNVYYLIPEISNLILSEDRILYIPAGYYLIDNHVVKCTDHNNNKTTKENEVIATCTSEGHYEEVVFCLICNKEISRVKITVPALTHDIGGWTDNNNGTHTGICNRDNCTYSETISCSYNSTVTHPTCTTNGYTTYTCAICLDSYVGDEVPATSHNDNNDDGICDSCGDELKADSDANNCSCRCHKDRFFARFIWKIINFFNRFLRRNQECDCGLKHW